MPISTTASVLNLQLFADGGGAAAGAPAGGTAAGEGTGSKAGDNSSNASFPAEDKATAEPRIIYGKQESATDNDDGNSETVPQKKLSFADLVKSEDYKDEAKAFMDKAFSKRFKEQDKLKAENAKMRSILDMQNMRYGLDPNSATYLDDFSNKVQNDTKLYEEEAVKAGLNVEEYLKVKNAERIIADNKRYEADRQRNEFVQNHVRNLVEQAEKLKSEFPAFDLESEMTNPQFKRLVDPPELGGAGISVDNAFRVIHNKEIMQATVNNAVNQTAINTANAVKANRGRPKENGLNHKASVIVKDDPSKLTKADFDRIKEEYRRTGVRPKF